MYKHNIEALSWNQCYQENVRNIMYFEYVSIAIVIQHAKCMCCIILSFVIVILVRFQWTLNFSDRFLKNTQILNFVKIRPLEAKLFHADGHDKANSCFLQFYKHSKNHFMCIKIALNLICSFPRRSILKWLLYTICSIAKMLKYFNERIIVK
jgi:hypothetical protein